MIRSRPRRSAGARALATVAAVALGTHLGCVPAAPPAAGPRAGSDPGPAAAPWEIPRDELGTQRLYRVRYDGPAGEGGLRVTLRLEAPDRYQVQAADPLGRPVWSLEVGGARGLWLDHRQRQGCRLEGRLEMAGVPLSPFPLLALPSLLLGRLPEPPAGEGAGRRPAAAGSSAGELEYADRDGRLWRARLRSGSAVGWSLWPAGDRPTASPPRITWLDNDGESILSDRLERVQLRWREVVVEPLAGPLEPLTLPEGYALLDCGAAAGRTGGAGDLTPP